MIDPANADPIVRKDHVAASPCRRGTLTVDCQLKPRPASPGEFLPDPLAARIGSIEILGTSRACLLAGQQRASGGAARPVHDPEVLRQGYWRLKLFATGFYIISAREAEQFRARNHAAGTRIRVVEDSAKVDVDEAVTLVSDFVSHHVALAHAQPYIIGEPCLNTFREGAARVIGVLVTHERFGAVVPDVYFGVEAGVRTVGEPTESCPARESRKVKSINGEAQCRGRTDDHAAFVAAERQPKIQ